MGRVGARILMPGAAAAVTSVAFTTIARTGRAWAKYNSRRMGYDRIAQRGIGHGVVVPGFAASVHRRMTGL